MAKIGGVVKIYDEEWERNDIFWRGRQNGEVLWSK